MNEQNPFEGYGQPQRRSYSADDLGYSSPETGGLFKNPVVAVLILLVSAGIFAFIVSATLSGGSNDGEVLPVVQADNAPIKEVPLERGGMEIPNQDSTVFAQLGEDDPDAGVVVEDLFATAESMPQDPLADLVDTADVIDAAASALEGDAPSDDGLEQTSSTKPAQLHPAGSSPETLAFVRSVLDEQKEGAAADAQPVLEENVIQEAVVEEPVVQESVVQETPPIAKETAVVQEPVALEKAAPIEPASLASSASGTHFVQLSSIKDEASAAAEWVKLQSKYSLLNGASYRVDRKELDDKGIFYRIQAGPFSKDKAVEVCESIKALAGGCFLVSK
jgi:hypothetical protein